MTSIQKAIKYLAMAFAIFLSVSIIGGIVTALAGISYIFTGSDSGKESAGEMQTYSVDGDISKLALNLSGAELKIKTAEKFSVESNNKYISVDTNNGKLRIGEAKKPFSVMSKGVTVVLSIPEGFIFDDADIDTGAGKVEIEELSADDLKLSLGAGEVQIKNLTANMSADIDGGAGELTIEDGLLRNLKLNMGVGELNLKSRIEGRSKLDYGIGEANLTLLGNSADYQIELDKGIGDADLEGENMKDDSVYGAGKNKIEIDGGIGDINIEFSEN